METVAAYLPLIAWAAGSTLVLFISAASLGVFGGLVIAVLRTSNLLPARWLAIGYIGVIQGTPVLIQLLIVHFGLSILGFRLGGMQSAALALGLFSAGFLGEIWRGALDAIPRPQMEAARTLGFSRLSALIWLIAPQAAWIALPATVGFAVTLIKTTSLASVIGVSELMKTGTMVANLSFEPMAVYGLVATIYFFLCWPLSTLSRRLERNRNGGR